ncbi:hypothetical protein A9Q99_13105 [Gammaproteobacteria bacterium 45_16_T64]|nr:hypothetical protein A9Q99_13105 [Gammaproteobacteria bacterium 45_16_T64]
MSVLPRVIQRIGFDPLVIFCLIAGGIFFVDEVVSHGGNQTLVISAETQSYILAQRLSLKGAGSDVAGLEPAEIDQAIQEYIDKEILLREAHRLGLDDDQIIRTRMLRKLEAIYSAEQRQPKENELTAYYLFHQDEFVAEPVFSFHQHYFSRQHHPPDDMLAQLAEAEDVSLLGDGVHKNTPPGDHDSRFPLVFTSVTQATVAARLGGHVAAALQDAPHGQWLGPIDSPFGQHFIRVNSVEQGRIKPYESVGKYVKNAWIRDEQNKRVTAKVAELRQQYTIRIEASQ